jgi:hypothetical protein
MVPDILSTGQSNKDVNLNSATPMKAKRGVPSWFGGKVSGAFANHIFFPSPPKKTKANTVKKVLFPACASSALWRETTRQKSAVQSSKFYKKTGGSSKASKTTAICHKDSTVPTDVSAPAREYGKESNGNETVTVGTDKTAPINVITTTRSIEKRAAMHVATRLTKAKSKRPARERNAETKRATMEHSGERASTTRLMLMTCDAAAKAKSSKLKQQVAKEMKTCKGSATAKCRRQKKNNITSASFACILCDEAYMEPPEEDWIQCDACQLWCHEACADISDPSKYVCDNCI